MVSTLFEAFENYNDNNISEQQMVENYCDLPHNNEKLSKCHNNNKKLSFIPL